jgi:hypothetical protein
MLRISVEVTSPFLVTATFILWKHWGESSYVGFATSTRTARNRRPVLAVRVDRGADNELAQFETTYELSDL